MPQQPCCQTVRAGRAAPLQMKAAYQAPDHTRQPDPEPASFGALTLTLTVIRA